MGGTLFQQAMLERECHPHVVAYYFKQWNGFHMQYHQHDATEIMYAIQGTCGVDIQIDVGNCIRLSLKKGDFIILDANVPHRLMVDEGMPCRMLNVEFRLSEATGFFPSMKKWADEDPVLSSLLYETASYLMLKDPDEVYHVLKSLVLELDKPDGRNETLVQLLITQLLIRISRLREEGRSSSLGQQEVYVRQSIEFLQQNYDRELHVKDVAAAVNLHPGYLQRIFKKQTGTTIMEYVTSIRMEKAKMLLLETDVPITEICDYIGIGSRQYFHMLFKAYTNLTPLAYRLSLNTHKMLE
ncbi:AraC family transcriptional regulator [Paenibacillus hexagrammi]|uniref:AraC family transcriptional regulator n=1 Tax=Paenibacillus hexagrammi TaxID=2908839 RepID=A0ABY3SM16_9BACL|nr:AraC family transcriptional regulator [Paenibacillus sp. YPD9-1]UJF34991.1 AraC family transcriptional regulator [Paenibacillus sp. YPD9-1]